MNVGIKKACIIILIAFITLSLVFLCLDYGMGQTRFLEGVVLSHHYIEAWTETRVFTDSQGHVSFDIINHPEEFHIICQQLPNEQSFDITTVHVQYDSLTNDQPITIQTRQGKWTHVQWVPRIK